MADPETGDSGVGSWLTVQPGLPQVITDVAVAISTFANFLLEILNIALTVLDVIKAFLVGFTDPITAIINVLIGEVQGFLQDLRQVGVYFSGDYQIIRPPFDQIRGGFSAYERRMLGRLIDKTDPTRPAFTSHTTVLAFFAYASVDVSQIAFLIQVIRKLCDLLNIETKMSGFSVATGLDVSYGTTGATLTGLTDMAALLKQGKTPQVANVKWSMAPPPGAGAVSWPLPAPAGFLIEVSTLKDGLYAAYSYTDKNTRVIPENDPGAGSLDRRVGVMLAPDNSPFRLFGGSDQLGIGDLSEFNDLIGRAKSGDGTTLLYGFKGASDNSPIPFNMLRGNVSATGEWSVDPAGSKYLLQRSFFMSTKTAAGSVFTMGPGQGFAYPLKYEDMPYDGDFEIDGSTGQVSVKNVGTEPARTVYVRVTPVSENVEKSTSSTTNFQWVADATSIQATAQAGKPVKFKASLTDNDRGKPSSPLTITFPSTTASEYLDMVVTALAVVLLSRSDLPIATNPTIYQTGVALTPTGLEDIATYAVPMLIGRNSQKYFSVADTNPALFRQNMLRRCRAVANDVYAKSGPLGSLESVAIELGKPLIDFKKTLSSGDMTILQMLESTDHNAGIGANPKSIGLPQRFTAQLLRSITIERAPGFMIRPMKGALIGGGSGSADFSPVIYDTMSPLPSDGSTSGISSSAIFGSDASVSFARNEFTSVYAAAAAVLNVAFAPGTLPAASGKWAAVRLFPQGLPAVESALDEIMGWVKTIQSGVLGIVDLILTYIDFIEARILEIESLISRINGLLQQLLAFQMPQVSALITVGQGTDGILQGLMSAGDKPTDMSTSYGAGVVVLAGGLPTFLADILRAIFTAGSED